MAKKAKIAMIFGLVAILGVAAWFYGYYHRKSTDNLPTLEMTVHMEEKEARSLLMGYQLDQLKEVWGEPVMGLFGMHGEIWETPFYYMTVYFDAENQVEDVRIAKRTYTFQAEIIEIAETQFLVEPLEGSSERNSYDRLYVPMEHMDASVEPEVGDVIEITYDGMIQELYPAILPNVFEITVIHEEEANTGQ